MPIDPMTAGLLGAAAGWAGQWFLIDKPVYRRVDTSATVAPVADANVGGDLQAKLDQCNKARTALEAKLVSSTEEIDRLKAEVGEANAAFASAKKEIADLRGKLPRTEDVRDDLEVIDGIGPVFERKLYDAGIYTFAQLAETSADKIRTVINPQKWQKIEPEKWIAEAAGLAKKAK